MPPADLLALRATMLILRDDAHARDMDDLALVYQASAMRLSMERYRLAMGRAPARIKR